MIRDRSGPRTKPRSLRAAGLAATMMLAMLPGIHALAAPAEGGDDADAAVQEDPADPAGGNRVFDLNPLPESRPTIEDLVRSRTSNTRILDGTRAKPGQWPSMVAIFLKRSGEKPFNFCGGTVIGSQWVLTAAHCAAAMQEAAESSGGIRFFIRENTIDLKKGGNDVPVDRIISFDGYDPDRTLNDVALLRLAGKVKSPRQALVARSLAPDLLVPPKPSTVTGFGVTSEDGAASNYLMQVDVPIVDQRKCQAAYGDDHITDANFCAGLEQGGKDSCQGDSGGPIFMRGADGESLQVGVVSWGKGCGRKGFPGVYASVGTFESWVKKNVPDAVFAKPAASAPAPVAQSLEAASNLTQGAASHEKPSELAHLSVDIVQGTNLKVGDYIDIRVISSVPGSLVLFNEDSDGRSYQIFPSEKMPSGDGSNTLAHVEAGRAVQIPDPKLRDQGFRFRVTPPAGQNWLIAMVIPEAAKAEDLVGRYANGATISSDELNSLINELVDRDIKSRGIEAVKTGPVDRATARLEYRIVP